MFCFIQVENTLVPSVKQKRRQLINKGNLTRKHSKNSSEQIDVKSKRKLNLGEEHINKEGKMIMAKKMGLPCIEKCQMKCREKLNNEDKKIIFNSYWSLGSHMRQRDFISSNIQMMSKKSSTTFGTSKGTSQPHRNYSRKYYFTTKLEKKSNLQIHVFTNFSHLGQSSD